MNPDSVFPTIHQLLIYVVSISSLDFFLWTLTKGSVFHHFFSLFNALHWQSDMLSLCSENGLWFQPWPLVPDASWSLCQSTAQFSHILRLETREHLQVHLIRDEFNTSHCIPTTFYLYISSITPKFQNWHSLTFNYAPVILNTFLFKWTSSNLTTKGWESSDLLLWLLLLRNFTTKSLSLVYKAETIFHSFSPLFPTLLFFSHSHICHSSKIHISSYFKTV